MSFNQLTNPEKGCHTRLTEKGSPTITQELTTIYVEYLAADHHILVRETGKEGNPHYHLWSYSLHDSKSLNKYRSWLSYRKWSGASRVCQSWGRKPKDLMYFMKGTAHDSEDYTKTVEVVSSTFSTQELQELHNLYYDFHQERSTKERATKINITTCLLAKCMEYLEDKPPTTTMTELEVADVFYEMRSGREPMEPRNASGALNSVFHEISKRNPETHKRHKRVMLQALVNAMTREYITPPVYIPITSSDLVEDCQLLDLPPSVDLTI